MARVTVEDCVDKVENRFELVLLASHRARQISQGQPITVDRDNDKNPVVALREIADETLSPGDLKEDLIHSLQKHVEVDEPEAAAPRRARRPSLSLPRPMPTKSRRSPSTACPRTISWPVSKVSSHPEERRLLIGFRRRITLDWGFRCTPGEPI